MLLTKYNHLFTQEQVEFLVQVYNFKRYRKPVEDVPSWLTRARIFRNGIYETIVQAYDVAKENSWIGTPTPAERRHNLAVLDEMLIDWLGI